MERTIESFNVWLSSKTKPYTLNKEEEESIIKFFFFATERGWKDLFYKENYKLLLKISKSYRHKLKTSDEELRAFFKILEELKADLFAVVPSDGVTSRNSAKGAAEEAKLLENKANQANKRRRLLHYNLGIELILTVWLILIPIYIFIDRGFSKDFIFDMITPMFYWLCGFIVLPILVSVKNEFQTFFTEKELKK